MYYLSAFVGGSDQPVARVVLTEATNVFIAVAELKAAFPGYQRIDVYSDEKRLFSVDGDGKTHPA